MIKKQDLPKLPKIVNVIKEFSLKKIMQKSVIIKEEDIQERLGKNYSFLSFLEMVSQDTEKKMSTPKQKSERSQSVQ